VNEHRKKNQQKSEREKAHMQSKRKEMEEKKLKDVQSSFVCMKRTRFNLKIEFGMFC
jgi:hypothetical protein